MSVTINPDPFHRHVYSLNYYERGGKLLKKWLGHS